MVRFCVTKRRRRLLFLHRCARAAPHSVLGQVQELAEAEEEARQAHLDPGTFVCFCRHKSNFSTIVLFYLRLCTVVPVSSLV